jgi:hypothetical protein
MIKRHFIGGETVIKIPAEKLSLDKEMIKTGGIKGSIARAIAQEKSGL